MSGFGVGVDLGGITPALQSVTIDPGGSFIKGGATSLFGKGMVMPVNPKQLLGQLPDPKKLALDLTQIVVGDVVEFAASYTGTMLAEVLTPPNPADIIAKAQSMMQDKIITVSQLMEKVSKAAEDEAKQFGNDDLDEQIKKKIAKINDKVSDIKDKVNGIVEKVEPQIAYIGYFITQGPKWVTAQANMISQKAKDEVAKFVYTQAKVVLDEKERFINEQADKFAYAAAKVMNDQIEEGLFKTLKEVMKLKQEAINFAKAAAKEAILQVLALVGG